MARVLAGGTVPEPEDDLERLLSSGTPAEVGERHHRIARALAEFDAAVLGKIVTPETIDFMRKLDVKEIHGYERARGLKLIKPDTVAARMRR